MFVYDLASDRAREITYGRLGRRNGVRQNITTNRKPTRATLGNLRVYIRRRRGLDKVTHCHEILAFDTINLFQK